MVESISLCLSEYLQKTKIPPIHTLWAQSPRPRHSCASPSTMYVTEGAV